MNGRKRRKAVLRRGRGKGRLLQINKGFTLIELLVVVIIIGLLATIAAPTYFKVIEKSYFAEASSVIQAFMRAQERYIQTYGKTTANISELDISLPGGNLVSCSYSSKCYEYKHFYYTVHIDGGALQARRRRSANMGNYRDYYYELPLSDYVYGGMPFKKGTLTCNVVYSMLSVPERNRAMQFCAYISGNKTYKSGNGAYYYTILN